jgi:hypothetical protein
LIDIFGKGEDVVCAIDCSYLPKSGKRTYGLGKYWSGCMGKTLKGIEISAITLISSAWQFCVSIEQTSAQTSQDNRLDSYLNHLGKLIEYIKTKTHIIVMDGFYAKAKMWKQVASWGVYAITKLRQDANFHYCYDGEQAARGRRKIKGHKVNWKTLDKQQWNLETQTQEGYQLYSQKLYATQWKCRLKVVYVAFQDKGTERYFLLASNHVELSAQKILQYYRQRFQIEFMFRDTKQHLGLQDCQSTKKQVLENHFNTVALCYNLAQVQAQQDGKQVFSLADIKTECFNQNWLNIIFSTLDLQQDLLKMHPEFNRLIHWGKIAA